MHIDQASTAELTAELAELEQRQQQFIGQKLQLDLTRGKPAAAQLNLSTAMLSIAPEALLDGGEELRNYGGLSGLPAAKALFGELLGLAATDCAERMFVGGNSSLSLMHYTLWFAYHLGLKTGDTPWQQVAQQTGQPIKILCPCPGYDRHFSLCNQLGIEMITVPLTGSGPDMKQVEALVAADSNIKGIWCVPRFSNPSGEVYSDETVTRLATLPAQAGENFLVLWDNAYAVHALDERAATLASIDRAAAEKGTLDSIVQFGSTSKITFAGAGVGYMASGAETIDGFSRHFALASIGPDKINQMRHVQFLRDTDTVRAHMAKHAAIIAPKFAAVNDSLERHLGGRGMGQWSVPTGGYFVSFDTRPGLAKQVVALAAEAGVKLTPAGATFPHGDDPDDANIRIAPTYPALDAVVDAMEVFVNCVALTSLRQRLAQEG